MFSLEQVREIITAYATMMNPTEEQKQLAEKRLNICMTCTDWKRNALGIDYCGLCGCTTKAKVFTDKGSGACPKGIWTV